ncbi:ribosomal protein L21e [Tanacetum coccineum]|uniref:Ribosomal protein L21e n=1 Tax=Tanacetum coccineum TaxID=301880 RepID=A0ABQ5ABP0_9ASTR
MSTVPETPPAANGAAATDADVNITAPEEDHPDSAVVPKLRAKIQLLEQDLVNDKLKIKHLEDEISSHESDKRALNSIAASASELEIQFSSLQHDLISSASDLKRKLVEFEAKERENVEIEFERNLLLEKLKEYEEKVRELQIVTARKFEVLLEKLKECEAKQRENSDKLSELEAVRPKRKVYSGFRCGGIKELGTLFLFKVGNRLIKKRIYVRVEPVMPSRCTEEFKQRVKKNDQLKAEAKA